MDAGTNVLLATYKPTRSSGRALKRSSKIGKMASSPDAMDTRMPELPCIVQFCCRPVLETMDQRVHFGSATYENHLESRSDLRLILQRTSLPRPSSMLPVFAIQLVDICAVTAEFFFRNARAFCANLTDQNCTLVLGLTVKTASRDRGALHVSKQDQESEIGRLQTNEDCGPRELGMRKRGTMPWVSVNVEYQRHPNHIGKTRRQSVPRATSKTFHRSHLRRRSHLTRVQNVVATAVDHKTQKKVH